MAGACPTSASGRPIEGGASPFSSTIARSRSSASTDRRCAASSSIRRRTTSDSPDEPLFLVYDVLTHRSPMSRDITSAPPAGLEPAPPAPEAGALSAELRGREMPGRSHEQGTIVVLAHGLSPRGRWGRQRAAVSCIPLATDHDVAPAPLESHP